MDARVRWFPHHGRRRDPEIRTNHLSLVYITKLGRYSDGPLTSKVINGTL